MASTWSSCVFLGVCDSPCPELHLSPFENKVGGYPVSMINISSFHQSPVSSNWLINWVAFFPFYWVNKPQWWYKGLLNCLELSLQNTRSSCNGVCWHQYQIMIIPAWACTAFSFPLAGLLFPSRPFLSAKLSMLWSSSPLAGAGVLPTGGLPFPQTDPRVLLWPANVLEQAREVWIYYRMCNINIFCCM